MAKLIDLTGQVFGRWTVVERDRRKTKKTMWFCRCECGSLRSIDAYCLAHKGTLSCGCSRIEQYPAETGNSYGLWTPDLTKKQLEILQHSLGVDEYGQGDMYRNHFCAGGSDEVICRELVDLGMMKTFQRSRLPYYNCTVTEEGKAAVLAQSPKPPKLSRGQRRYRQYLNEDTGHSFGEWLTRKRA